MGTAVTSRFSPKRVSSRHYTGAMPPLDPRTHFIEPMLRLPAKRLPDGLEWTYELKLDGYRALAIKTDGEVRPRSRVRRISNRKYPAIAKALASLPRWSRLTTLGGPRSPR